MSRHTSLTPEAHARAVELAGRGRPKALIAVELGVHRDTLYEWLDRGDREPGSVFDAFARDFRRARAAWVFATLDKIEAGAKGWQALAWMLERIVPEEFGARARLEHTGPDGGPVQHQVQVDADDLFRRLQALRARGGGGPEPGGAAPAAAG